VRILSVILLLWLATAPALLGQTTPAAEADSSVLSVEEFYTLVVQNHPLALQARLIRVNAEAERLKASGAFDPKLFSDIQQKYFDDKDYFQLQNSGVEIPAWYGLKAKAGYELNEGLFLNGQNSVPASGLWYADLSLTLGKGLFIDQRRAMLKQARLLQEAAEYDVLSAYNKLLEKALSQYWDWHNSYQTVLVYQNALNAAQFRFEGVKSQAIVGDKPLVDTLEAAIQVQDRQLKLQKAQADFITQTNTLETFLWLEGMVPLELKNGTVPIFSNPAVVQLPQNWLTNHPILRSKNLKIDRLDISQRLNREALKPQVDLSYKFLNQPTVNDFFAEYAINNYAWAVTASFPIFLRKERGQIAKTQVKLDEASLDLDLKRLEINNKVQALRQEFDLTMSQLLEMRSMVANYQRLLQAETIKFQNGESSLFLINSRELKYLDSQEKLIQLEAKVNQIQAKLRAAAGVLGNDAE
jgi:outer membrane protein TolC